MITPNDIETKVFSFSVRGYNRREVDEFLDQIMIDYQALLDQNAKMLERVHVLQKQVTEAKDPANMTRDAKHLMNDISASAEQKAEVIIKNAQREAESIVKNAKNSTSQADEDAERLRQKVEKFKLRFKQLLEDEIERVDDTSEDLLDDLRKDFYPTFAYHESEAADYTRIAGSDDDLIADLPEVEPEDEADEMASAGAEEPVESEEPTDAEEVGEESEEPEYTEDAAGPEEAIEEAGEEEGLEGSEEQEEPVEEAFEEAEVVEETAEVPDEEPAEEVEEAFDEAEEVSEGETQEEEAEEPEAVEEAEYSEYEEQQGEAAEDGQGTERAEEGDEAAAQEEAADDPLLARAKEANVDLDDLPGFRSSASSMDDTVVIKKMQKDSTMEIGTGDMANEPQESLGEEAAEKAKELKDTAAKFVNGLFSKKDK